MHEPLKNRTYFCKKQSVLGPGEESVNKQNDYEKASKK